MCWNYLCDDNTLSIYFFLWRCGPTWVMASSILRFLDHIRRITLGRTPLDEWSVRRRNFWRQTSITTDKHPCPRRDSNPQSQPASSCSPKPQTARPLESSSIYLLSVKLYRRSQWPRGLCRGSATTRLKGLRVRIPPGTWMSVCCECCVLSGRGLCDGLITCPEETYRVWCV